MYTDHVRDQIMMDVEVLFVSNFHCRKLLIDEFVFFVCVLVMLVMHELKRKSKALSVESKIFNSLEIFELFSVH